MLAFKIWIIASILLTTYGGVLDSDDDFCAQSDSDMCHTEETKNVQFPADIEDLDKMCPAITTRLGCLMNYQRRCGIQETEGIEAKLGIVYELTLDACDKGSELHKEFADNLPCLKRMISSHHDSCYPIVADSVEAFKARLRFENDEGQWDMDDYRKLMCLHEAFEFACFIAHAGVSCGSETKEFAGRILDRVGILETVCQADIHEEVKKMVEIMQAEMEERMVFEAISSKD